MKTKTIRQQVTFKARPHDVYEALMDSRKHSKFTASEAKTSRKVGGKWSAWSGNIAGVNLELVPDRKIVQSWRGVDWPEGHYSNVTFFLQETGSGTRLTFTHSGIPVEFCADIRQGWREFYWKPMKQMLEIIDTPG